MENGYFYIERKIFNSWIAERHDKFYAWIYMIHRAQILNKNLNQKVKFGNEFIYLQPGEFITSINNLSSEIGMTTQQTRTFLKELNSSGSIRLETRSNSTKITICNYNDYQDKQQTNNKQITNEQQTNNKQITTNEVNKKVSKKVSKNILLQKFETFWNKYPKKTEKQDSLKAFENALKQDSAEHIMQRLELFIELDFKHRELKYIPSARKWLTKDRYNEQPVDNKQQTQVPIHSIESEITQEEIDSCEYFNRSK